jgi:pSer/pThr/pTyr-binding forkhead associated (FHA) protein
MWVLEVLTTGKQFVVRGPVVKFGRAPDNDFPFGQDKSISRNHAELHIGKATTPATPHSASHNDSTAAAAADSDDDVIEVLDKTSSFGSFLDGIKMEGKKRYRVQSGSVVTLGGSTPPTRIKIT